MDASKKRQVKSDQFSKLFSSTEWKLRPLSDMIFRTHLRTSDFRNTEDIPPSCHTQWQETVLASRDKEICPPSRSTCWIWFAPAKRGSFPDEITKNRKSMVVGDQAEQCKTGIASYWRYCRGPKRKRDGPAAVVVVAGRGASAGSFKR